MFKRTLALVAVTITAATFSITFAGAAAERNARASVNHQAITVGGKPFFPVMLIDQCTPDAVAHAARMGINAILNEHCDGISSQGQLGMIQSKSLAILSIGEQRVGGSRLLGWTFPDEPENNGWSPASLRRAHPYESGSADGLLSFVTTSGGFFKKPYTDARFPPATYGQFARMADVSGFDLYPLGHCQSDLNAVYEAQREFIKLAGGRPTFQWIETGPIKPTYCGGFKMTAAQLNAEVWLAIIGGARGIGFFTHTWSPAHNAFDVTSTIQGSMKRIAGFLGALKPGLVGLTVPSGVNSGAIRVIARVSAHRNYIFAINTQPGPITAQVHVPRLHDGPLQVFGEKRSVTVSNNRFIDVFKPLAVHVYVQKP